MSQTRKFLLDAGSNYLRMVATILGTLFLTRAMALRWGVDEFGRWSLITTVMSLTMLLDLGLSNVVLKATGSSAREDSSAILSSVLTALLAVSGFAGIVLALVLSWTLPGRDNTLVLAVVLLTLRATVASLPWTVCRSALYARGHMSVTNAMQSTGILAYSAVACIALTQGANLAVIAAISLAAAVVDSAMLVVLLRRCIPDIGLRLSFDYSSLRPTLSLGGASLLVNIAGFILLKTDPIIVKAFLPFAQVAMYAVALRIAENIFLLCKQLVNALTPHAIRAGVDGNNAQRARLFERATRYVMAVGVPLYVCELVLGRTCITLWLSPDYASSAAILNILLLAMVLSIPQLVGSNLLTFSGRHRKTATFITIGAFINVAASVLFVHLIGTAGVAYGTLVTTLIIDVSIMIPYACRSFEMSIPKFLLTLFKAIVLPACLQALVLLALRDHFAASFLWQVVLQGALSCLVFGVAFLALGTTASERQVLVLEGFAIRRPRLDPMLAAESL